MVLLNFATAKGMSFGLFIKREGNFGTPAMCVKREATWR